jgi:NhaA family Na+:H+ antiporter
MLGFAIPVLRSATDGGPKASPDLAGVFENRLRPVSAGIAVPLFAFFSAGVSVGGGDGVLSALTDPVTGGVILALLGKPVGIMATTWRTTKFTKARLDRSFEWIGVFGVSVLAGIGFTVSLLVAELSFGQGIPHNDHAKVAILTASALASLLSAAILIPQNLHYRRLEAEELIDADNNGIPDVFEQPVKKPAHD